LTGLDEPVLATRSTGFFSAISILFVRTGREVDLLMSGAGDEVDLVLSAGVCWAGAGG
jgi:hypothetical protein